MKALSCKFYMVIILVFSILIGLSCSNDSDLLAEAVLPDITLNEGLVDDDYFVIQPYESSILNVLSNDDFSQDDSIQITEISSPLFGTVEISEDSLSVIYTPQNQTEEQSDDDEAAEENGTTDTFTYTTEVINDDDSTTTEVGTVEVVVESTDDATTTDDDESSSDDDTDDEGENEDPTTENTEPVANLLFSSGFEGVSLSAPNEGYQYLSGTDSSTGFEWPMRILGSDFSGIHRVNDDNGKAIENKIESTTGPNGNQTSALFQKVNYDVQVTQTPYQINNIKENPNELYICYWMKTDDTSVKGIDKWRAIWEYKTDKYATNKDGFRMIAYMATDYEGKPYWLFQGDTSPQDPVWQVENYDIPLIMNEWFQVEYYIKWSNSSDGYASMKVNGQLIGEHHGSTTSNSDDMDFIMLTQVYGNSYPMHQWVDDIEVWDGLPN